MFEFLEPIQFLLYTPGRGGGSAQPHLGFFGVVSAHEGIQVLYFTVMAVAAFYAILWVPAVAEKLQYGLLLRKDKEWRDTVMEYRKEYLIYARVGVAGATPANQGPYPTPPKGCPEKWWVSGNFPSRPTGD